MAEKATVDVGKFHAAALHDNGSGGKEAGEGVLREAGSAPPGKGGDESPGKAGAEDVDPHTNDGARVENGTDSRLGMIAHDEAAEAEAGGAEMAGSVVPEAHLVVGVLEVRVVGGGTEVAPLTEDGVAEETVVRLVGVGHEDDVIKLAAALGIRTDDGGAVDTGAHVEDGVVAEGDRAAQKAALHNLGTMAHVDGAAVSVDDGVAEDGVRLDEEGMRTADTNARGDGGGSPAGGKTPEVSEETRVKAGKGMVGVSDAVEGKGVGQSTRIGGRKGKGIARGSGVAYGMKGSIESVDGGCIGPEGEEEVGLPEGLAGTEGENGVDEGGVGGEGGVNEEVVRGNGEGVFFTEIRASKVGGGEMQVVLPLLTEGEDAGPKLGHGTGEGKGTKGVPGVVVE